MFNPDVAVISAPSPFPLFLSTAEPLTVLEHFPEVVNNLCLYWPHGKWGDWFLGKEVSDEVLEYPSELITLEDSRARGNRDVGYTFFLTWEPPRRKEYSHKHELQPGAVTWVPVQFAHHLRPQLDLLPVIPSGPSCTAVLLGDQAKYKSLSTVLCWSHGKSFMHCIHFFLSHKHSNTFLPRGGEDST